MRQLQQYRFYDLGAKLYGIFNMRSQARVADLFGPLTDAQKSLDALIKGDPIELKFSKAEAVKLLTQISTLFEKYFIDQASRQLRFPSQEEKIDSQEVALIELALQKFESAFAAELARTVVFPITQRGIYSAVDLVENAHCAVPDDLQLYVPASARRELDAAGRALGFDLGTAAVLHCLRALELVTGRYFEEFGELPTSKAERNLATLLRRLTAIVEDESATKQPDPRLLQLLLQIKDGYRNPLLQAEAVTETGTALTLFGLVASVITQIAEHIEQLQATKPQSVSGQQTVISPIQNSGAEMVLPSDSDDEEDEDIYDFRVSQTG